MSLTFPISVLEDLRSKLLLKHRFARLPSATPEAVLVSKFAWIATVLQTSR